MNFLGQNRKFYIINDFFAVLSDILYNSNKIFNSYQNCKKLLDKRKIIDYNISILFLPNL